MQSKADIRRQLMASRQQLSERVLHDASKRVTQTVLGGAIAWDSAHHVHSYAANAIWRELDTATILQELERRYSDIIVETSASTFDAPIPFEKSYDMIIVPVLGFDMTGNRIGFGKGWYDRFLARQPQALKIGLAYSWSQVAMLPHEQHDIPLDIIVTENGLIRF